MLSLEQSTVGFLDEGISGNETVRPLEDNRMGRYKIMSHGFAYIFNAFVLCPFSFSDKMTL